MSEPVFRKDEEQHDAGQQPVEQSAVPAPQPTLPVPEPATATQQPSPAGTAAAAPLPKEFDPGSAAGQPTLPEYNFGSSPDIPDGKYNFKVTSAEKLDPWVNKETGEISEPWVYKVKLTLLIGGLDMSLPVQFRLININELPRNTSPEELAKQKEQANWKQRDFSSVLKAAGMWDMSRTPQSEAANNMLLAKIFVEGEVSSLVGVVFSGKLTVNGQYTNINFITDADPKLP